MAEKNKEKKDLKSKKDSKFMLFLKNEKFHFLIGVFLILFSGFLLLSLISYLFTWKSDNIQWISTISSSNIVVENWGGKLGATLSNLFLFSWFGIPSFIFVFIFSIIGLFLIRIKPLKLSKVLKITTLSIIWLSIALGLADNILTNQEFLLGGSYGYFISKWLISFAGIFGTATILITILLSFLILYSNKFYNFTQQKLGLVKTNKTEEIPETITSENTTSNISDNNIIDDKKTTNNLINDENEKDIEIIDVSKETTNLGNLEITDTTKENDDEIINTNNTEEIIEIDENNIEKPLEIETINNNDDDDFFIKEQGLFDPTLDLSFYKMPSPELLENHTSNDSEVTPEELNANKNKIVETLENYNIKIDKIKATIGPTITLYEIVPAPGVRISKIKSLEDDIALSLAALGIRIIAPMPGRGTVGIEVPNAKPEIVSMRKVILSKAFQESKYELPIVLGKTISNETFILDLAKTPHMLVAGATGQGKSVGINAILTSLLYKKHPAQLKLILVDPKQVELSIYSKIEKHYLAKLPDEEDAIITDVQKVVRTLNSLTIEMDNRYKILKSVDARNIIEYNNKFINRKLNPNKGHKFLPYIVVVIDEFADLIMTAGKEVETPIARIAQLARAVGIHMIIATQRPSTNIITGIIKANFPTRVAFRVSSMIDSRTILDSTGANHLIGRGDMLISQGNDLIRVQCAFVDTPEVAKITKHISEQQGYASAFYLPEVGEVSEAGISNFDNNEKDPMFEEAARLIIGSQQGSTSSIQRKFSIGYNRAGRIMDQLETAGIVGPFEGSKARKVLFSDEYSLEQYLKTL